MTTRNVASTLADPRELSKSDIQLLSRAILGFVVAGEKVTFDCLDHEPSPGSPAQLAWRSAFSKHVGEAFLVMQYANLSAFDHSRAFVALLRTPTVRSTALATVVRGAVESFARTFHILSHADQADLAHRTITLLHNDLFFPYRFGEEIMTRDGDAVDVAAKRSFYADELRRLGLPQPSKTNLSGMVVAMLDSEIQDGRGNVRYSTLSATAHAHRLGINNFVVTDETGGVSGLVAPRLVVGEIATVLLASTSAATMKFARFYGAQTRHMELLRAAEYRAFEAIAAFDADKP
jgi:hypothetical protein